MKHKLIIISLNDTKAECECGKWSMECRGEKRKEEVMWEYRRHLNRRRW